MRRCAMFLTGIALCAAPAFGQTDSEPEIRDRIVGTWKLVSAQETLKDGTTRPFPFFGLHAKGLLMYQRDGYMCAQLVNRHPAWIGRPGACDTGRKTGGRRGHVWLLWPL
jgi:hypothetical protein